MHEDETVVVTDRAVTSARAVSERWQDQTISGCPDSRPAGERECRSAGRALRGRRRTRRAAAPCPRRRCGARHRRAAHTCVVSLSRRVAVSWCSVLTSSPCCASLSPQAAVIRPGTSSTSAPRRRPASVRVHEDGPLVLRAAASADEALLLQALEQRRERVAGQPEPAGDPRHRRRTVLAEHRQDRVLRVGEPVPLEQRAVGRVHGVRRLVQRQAQPLVDGHVRRSRRHRDECRRRP